MPSLFKRSLIRVGKDSLVVVVPKSWIRYYGMKPGDRLEVIANDELTIRPVKQAKRKARKNG